MKYCPARPGAEAPDTPETCPAAYWLWVFRSAGGGRFTRGRGNPCLSDGAGTPEALPQAYPGTGAGYRSAGKNPGTAGPRRPRGRIPSHSPTDWPTPAVPAPQAGWVPQSVPAAVFRAGNCHSGPYRAITSLLPAAGQDSFFSMGSIADANRAVSFAIPSDGACCTARAWI